MSAEASGLNSESAPAKTWRSQQKALRRRQLLRAAASLLADHGFLGVRLEDLGSAVGISGPAVYRHFASKEALLVELLTDVSQRLLDGGRLVVASTRAPRGALAGLIDFHLDFAIGEPELIKIQDRELNRLPVAAHRQVRRTQREYVEVWVTVIQRTTPGLTETDARIKAHAVFGLLNSTPHSVKAPAIQTRAVLRQMALAALGQPVRATRTS